MKREIFEKTLRDVAMFEYIGSVFSEVKVLYCVEQEGKMCFRNVSVL